MWFNKQDLEIEMIILGLYILSVLLNVFVLMPLCVKAYGVY